MVRSFLSSISFCSLLLLTTTTASAQFRLENPANGSIQSGQGIISGWVCNAVLIEVVVDGNFAVQAPYGTMRGDTRGTCGDLNNGFAFQINWNELGDGPHSISVRADGTVFAQVTFTVQTLGTRVLTGAAGSYELRGFADKNVTVTWSEPLQNFVITGWTPSTTPPPPPPPGASLQDILGRWTFTYEIIHTFTDHYLLPAVTTEDGLSGIRGTDVDGGGQVAVFRIEDLTAEPFPFDFALLDPDMTVCNFFIFNKTGANTVSGQYFLLTKNAEGNCTKLFSGTPRAMNGLRTASALSTQTAPPFLILDTQKQHEDQAAPAVTNGIEEEPQADHAVLMEILQNMQKR